MKEFQEQNMETQFFVIRFIGFIAYLFFHNSKVAVE